MVFSPNFVEKILRPNLGVKRKKTQKKNHTKEHSSKPPTNKLKVYRFVGPALDSNRDYHIGSNFWKFYLIRTGFTLGEPVSSAKVFKLFRLEQIFFGV